MNSLEQDAKWDMLRRRKAERDALIAKYPGACPAWVSAEIAVLTRDIENLEGALGDA